MATTRWIAVCAGLSLAPAAGPVVSRPETAQSSPARPVRGGGTAVVSPSVVASSSMYRDSSGLITVDVLILWRGSPGWPFRRNAPGGSTSGGSPDRNGRITFSIQQGGLQLTAEFDPLTRAATVLGERVELKDANVILVDRVDSADGPAIAGTASLPPRAGYSSYEVGASLPLIIRDAPHLLPYLRCEAQVSESRAHTTSISDCCFGSGSLRSQRRNAASSGDRAMIGRTISGYLPLTAAVNSGSTFSKNRP